MATQKFKLVILRAETQCYDHEWVVFDDIDTLREVSTGYVGDQVELVGDKAIGDVQRWNRITARIIKEGS